jgi:hypothetical protein
VGDKALKIAASEAAVLHKYLEKQRQISDLLVTGGDPMVMKTRNLAPYLLPLLGPDFGHIQTLRLGTKSLSFWPYRFVGDEDADALLRLLEQLVLGGKHVAILAHYDHPQELSTDIAREAIRRLRDTRASRSEARRPCATSMTTPIPGSSCGERRSLSALSPSICSLRGIRGLSTTSKCPCIGRGISIEIRYSGYPG